MKSVSDKEKKEIGGGAEVSDNILNNFNNIMNYYEE